MSTKTASGTKNIVRAKGIGISVKLFRFKEAEMSSSEVMRLIKEMQYSPHSPDEEAAGFISARTIGDVIVGDYAARLRASVMTFDPDGNMTPMSYFFEDRGEVRVKLDRRTVEIRGSGRMARRAKKQVEEILQTELMPLNLDGGARQLYDRASKVTAVLISDIEKGHLRQVEFRGDGIQREEEIGLYERKFRGHISKFRGVFKSPNGPHEVLASINAESGSLVVYRTPRAPGILEKDLRWIVDMMETASLGPGGPA